MKIIDPKTCKKPPKADMYLPLWIQIFGFVLDTLAVAAIPVAILFELWWLLFVTPLFGIFGVAAHLCWCNQKVRILDEETFEYTTFLGKKIVYAFKDIREIRVRTDDYTIFVGEGRVHVESSAVMTETFMLKIEEALSKNEGAAQ